MDAILFRSRAAALVLSVGALLSSPVLADDAKPAGAATPGVTAPRLRVTANFRVEQILGNDATGSLIAIAFNENGDLLASRENGPLLVIRDKDRNGRIETVDTYCALVKNCQGILPLNGSVFVTAEGPDGVALYRLDDKDQDGHAEVAAPLIKFLGTPGEHGPHAIVMGPDGLLYISIGNHVTLAAEPEKTSPYRDIYEGDIVQPRHEDPNGQDGGVKAPAGFILRTDLEGKFVERFAGGLRNAYDLAFTASGELITHDADAESDAGAPWYRQTRLLHVTPGAEFGFRSGWAKWPGHYLDSLSPILETGAGSPAGMVIYDHVMLPQSLHGALFVADWAKGQIVAYRLKRNGSTYQATSEVFVQGTPLNATDVAVGPDGWLYFATGGRGTEGGVYRLVWNGRIPPGIADPGAGVMAAVRQQQFESAWARQRIARVRLQHGKEWKAILTALARRPDARVEQRLRALDLLQLFGPPPERYVLVSLTKDAQPAVRAKATYLLGIHADETVSPVFTQLVHDADPFVRRTAIESITRSGMSSTLGTLVVPLVSPDRHLASSSRRTLERIPADKWEKSAMGSRDPRVFLEGATAVLVARPEQESARNVIERGRQMMAQFLPDREFIDLLRVFQLAVMRGNLPDAELAPLGAQLAEEYPSKSDAINRELVRLLVRLQAVGAAERMFEQLNAPLPLQEKIHLAMHLPRLKHDWTSQQKLAIMKFYEQARQSPAGSSIGRYLEKAAVELAAKFNDSEQAQLLKDGVNLPTGSLAVLPYQKLPLADDRLQSMVDLDRRLANATGDANDRLKVGIVAVLARSGQPEAMAYLREVFANQAERRGAVAMGLAQSPDGENWPLLVQSLPILEGFAAQEVLSRLAQVDRKPDEPEAVRQVILKGLKLRETGARQAVALLEHWTGEKQESENDAWEASLAKWQDWFRQKYPQLPEPALPAESTAGKWKLSELVAYLASPDAAKADSVRGRHVFTAAQCAKCHRHGDLGEAVGPDLSTVARRFQKKEVLESILYPSHIISTQFASKVVRTTDGQVIGGLVTQHPDGGITILTPTAEKVTLTEDQVDQIAPSAVSAMPEGLLNDLSQQQIADLMAYLLAAPGASVTQEPADTKTK